MSFQHRLLTTFVGAVMIVLALGSCLTASAQTENSLPTVTASSVPFYPPVARMAHIEGKVLLKLSTDGERVSSVSVEDGPPMLVAAAEANVKTWHFEKHEPMQFEVTFHYNLMPGECDAKCNCDSTGNQTSLLRLPVDIEVVAKTAMVCDPAGVIKR